MLRRYVETYYPVKLEGLKGQGQKACQPSRLSLWQEGGVGWVKIRRAVILAEGGTPLKVPAYLGGLMGIPLRSTVLTDAVRIFGNDAADEMFAGWVACWLMERYDLNQ